MLLRYINIANELHEIRRLLTDLGWEQFQKVWDRIECFRQALWSLMQLSSSWLRDVICILTPSALVFVSRHVFYCVTYPQFWGVGKWAECDLEFQNVQPKCLKWKRVSQVGKLHVIYTQLAKSVYTIHRLTSVFLQTICKVLSSESTWSSIACKKNCSTEIIKSVIYYDTLTNSLTFPWIF